MKIGPFNFGKKNEDCNREIVPTESVEIVFSESDDGLDLSRYDVVEIDPESVGGRDFFDSLVPLAGNVADAVAQYDHAIVKFPEGIGWNDLLNRKTPGWEQFKQCGGFGKNGKFNPQAAIRQVKVSPVQVANIALQAAAVAVGQAYMTEISNRLGGIEEGIARIQREMELERDSKIEASFLVLRDYIEHFAEYSEIPEKRQAVLNNLEGIKRDALSAWKFQIRSLNDLGVRVKDARKLDNAGVRNFLGMLESCDKSSAAIYTVLMMESQAQIQYSATFGSERLKAAQRDSLRYLEEYEKARSVVQESLRKKIGGLKGKPLVPPELEDDGYEASNPVAGALHGIKRNAGRYSPRAMRAEAKRSLSSQKRGLSAAASTEAPLVELAEQRRIELERQDAIFNGASVVIVDEERIRFLVPKHDECDGGSNTQE